MILFLPLESGLEESSFSPAEDAAKTVESPSERDDSPSR